MSRISFTEPATQDLEEIYAYIAKDSIVEADKHLERLKASWRLLADHPRIGSKRIDIQSDLRSLTEGNYVVFYRILKDSVEIVRVLHASRDPHQFFEKAD